MLRPLEKRLRLTIFGELVRGDSRYRALSNALERGPTSCVESLN